jgi:hypothetical protein
VLLATIQWDPALGRRPDVGPAYRMTPSDLEFHANFTHEVNAVRRAKRDREGES